MRTRVALDSPCGLSWIRASRRPSVVRHPVNTIRMADLFCGCGGLSLGIAEACRIERVALEIALAIDANQDALRVYEGNFKSVCRRTDSTRIELLFRGRSESALSPQERQLAREIGTVDLLIAGPPCQGHSDLNNHTRRLDQRNALYARVARAAQVLKPRVVVIENVTAVRNDRGRTVARTEGVLKSLRYSVQSVCIDAADLGVPQRRRRHFLIAVRGRPMEFPPLPTYTATTWSIGDVISGLEDEPRSSKSMFTTPSTCSPRNRERIRYLFETGKYELPDSQRPTCHRDNHHSYKSVYGRLRWDGIANTITSGFGSMGQGRYVHPRRRRLITPHEAARLMGFPDWFRFDEVGSRGALQTLIGNAVIPRVAAWLALHLIRSSVL